MTTNDDPARREQTLAMLDHLLAHWETFCEEYQPGTMPETFIAELHELYFYRTGLTDDPWRWELPLPAMQDFQATWFEDHVKIHWWKLRERIDQAVRPMRAKWHLARVILVVGRHYAPIWAGLKIQIGKRRLQRNPALGWVMGLIALWPALWALIHR